MGGRTIRPWQPSIPGGWHGKALEEALYEETGAWRARLDELLDTHPDAASILTQMIDETSARLPSS